MQLVTPLFSFKSNY